MADSKHFSCGDDVLLLRAASAATPWQAARVMDAWDALAQRLGGYPCFPRDKDARAVRTRFHLLLKKHRANKLASMRTTGDSDELLHRERLLREVDAKLRAFELCKRGGRGEESEPSGEDSDEREEDGRESTKKTASKKRRRSEDGDGDGETSRKVVALLERVLDQQQQQITMQREQIERQIAMQQQQMQMLVELVQRVANR